jgi:hypothetical protein
MIRVDLKRHGEPDAKRVLMRPPAKFVLVGAMPDVLTTGAPWGALLKRALTWPKGTVVTLSATDEETGRTIFLRGRVK